MATQSHGGRPSNEIWKNESTSNPTVTDDSAAGYVIGSRWINTSSNAEYVCLDNSVGAAVWTETTAGAAGGESNTASSAGSGSSIFYQKSGVDLQFNAIKSENALLSVAVDGVTHDVELTVNQASIDHDALTNFVAAEHIDWSVTGAEQIHADRYTAGGGSFMLGFSGAAATVAKGATSYLGIGSGHVASTEANAQFQVEMAGTIDKLRAYCSANATGVTGNNLTIRKNGVATSLTIDFGTGTGEQEDTANSFTVAAGDLISIEQVNAGSGGGTKDLVVESVSFRLTPS